MNREVKKSTEKIGNIVADGYKGYSLVAEQVENDTLKSMFSQLAGQREQFISEINTEFPVNKETSVSPEEDGTVKGYFHRTWMDMKDTLTQDDDKLVSEAIRGEKEALDTYNEVLSTSDMPKDLTNVLIEQRNQVQSSLRQLEEMTIEA